MALRKASARDLDAVLALAEQARSWRCGVGRSATENLRAGFERHGEAATAVVENRGTLSGFARLGPRAASGYELCAIATSEPEFARLVDWAIAACPPREVVWTSCSVTGPVKGLLAGLSFAPGISQRTMQLLNRIAATDQLVEPYRLAPFEQARLASLLATYCAAWPDEDVDEVEAGRSLLESDGLVLAEAGEDVVGYAMWEIVGDNVGMIHEVSVHADHRRRGIGSALTTYAVRHLLCEGPAPRAPLREARRIELLVVGENPAQEMYAALGFEVVEDVVFMARRARPR